MKLSELSEATARINSINALRERRDDAYATLESVETRREADVNTGFFDEVRICGAAVEHIIAALRQQIVDIEFELTALGVEIDMPPGPVDASDDDSDDFEEAA